MISNGSSNDVKIVLKDGEILANKDVLSARSEYFATMFSTNRFLEGETNSVTFDYCSKAIMEKIIKYLFSGDMMLHDFSLTDLLKMLNMTTLMILGDVNDVIQEYVLELIPDSGENCGSIPDLVESLMLAEQFKLGSINDALVCELIRSLRDIPHIPEVVENSDAFTSLPLNLIKKLFLNNDEDSDEEDDEDEDWNKETDKRIPTTKEEFDAFAFWLSVNECSDKDTREIANSFNFDDFTAQDLLTDVRRSGLFSIKKIDARVLEILAEKEKEKEKLVKVKDALINSNARSMKDKDATIKNKNAEICTLKNYLAAQNLQIEKREICSFCTRCYRC